MTEVTAEIVRLQTRLMTALRAADRAAARRVIDDAFAEGLDGLDVLDQLLAPAMREIGRLWEIGEMTIADEHLATVIAHGTLTRVYPRLPGGEPRSLGTVLLAGADGEQHLLGLRMIADVLEAAGYDVRNVGAALTPDALATAIVRHRPVLVGLANTLGGPRPLIRSVQAARDAAPGIPILLGGASAADLDREGIVPDAQTVICGSAREALEAAQRLTK